MKILKYTKKKNGLYEVNLEDNSKLLLYEDVILSNDLLITKEINKDNIDNILKENRFYDCYFACLKMIKARLRSVKEVKDKMVNGGYSEDIVLKVIEKLKKQGYLNDSFYAKSFLNNAQITTYHGPKKIYSDLKKKGINESIINDTISLYDLDTQKDKCLKIASHLNKSNKNVSNNILKKKIESKLRMEGFSSSAIEYAISNTEFKDDKEIYDKEYDKAYKKLSKKYSGNELELRIKKYMYTKGF